VVKQDLEVLERLYRPGFKPEKEGEYIILTTHNAKADVINQKELARLPGTLHKFQARISGEFNERNFTTERELCLKEGSQVMFIKNDKGETRRYYNGKIGTVKRMKGKDIFVVFPGEQEELLVEEETWQNIRY